LGLVTSNDQVLIWDQQGGTLTPLTTIPKENIASLAFSPDNRLLAIGTVDTALLYDLSLSEEVFRIQLTGTVNNISFSADSTTLMTSTLKFLQFWDLTTLKTRQTTRQDIVETACRHLFENFSRNQWSRLFESNPYQALCPNLPTP
jgi:WD40 repeat protein